MLLLWLLHAYKPNELEMLLLWLLHAYKPIVMAAACLQTK
jgi:hypothetical protein